MLRRILPHLLLVLGLCSGTLLFAQSSAVTQEQNGSKVYLKIDPQFLRSDLDNLFSQTNNLSLQLASTTWADILTNGTSPGVDVNFSGFHAFGLGDLTAGGTLTADSLVLLKDASIAGGLAVNLNVIIEQSLYVDSVRNNPSTDLTLFSNEDFKLDVNTDIFMDAGDDFDITTNDRFSVVADDSVYIGVDASGDADFLIMTERGGTNPFLWLQDPSIAAGDNFTHLFNEDGMRLSVGNDNNDVGIEMHDRSDIMILYADSMYVPVTRTIFHQIDPDDLNEPHPLLGGQEHIFMTDNFSTAHAGIMQHLPAVTDGTANLLSLYSVDHVSIAVGGAVNAGIEMTETGPEGHLVLYADSMALKGEVVVPDHMIVEQLEVNQVIDGQVNSLANLNTDELVETSTNRYYTPAREQALRAQLDSLSNRLGELLDLLFDAATITTDAATAVLATTASIHATYNEGGAAIVASGFILSEHSDLSDSTVFNVTGSSNALLKALSSLTEGTTYYYRAFIETIMGRAEGATLSFTTVADATVSTLAVTDAGQTTATLRGSVDQTGGGTVSATGFKYSTSAALVGATDVAGSATSGTYTNALSGLAQNTTYYYAAYATNEAGTSYGDTLDFSTVGPCNGATTVNYQGYDYDIVEIGTQCWFAENLRYNNPSWSPCAPPPTNYTNSSALSSSSCSGDAGYIATYGYLYPQLLINVCPSGWSVPSNAQFNTLLSAVGNNALALQSTTGWGPSLSGGGTNSSGFNALPAGAFDDAGSMSIRFSGVGERALFWSSSFGIFYGTEPLHLVYNSSTVGPFWWAGQDGGGGSNFASIRCIKN